MESQEDLCCWHDLMMMIMMIHMCVFMYSPSVKIRWLIGKKQLLCWQRKSGRIFFYCKVTYHIVGIRLAEVNVLATVHMVVFVHQSPECFRAVIYLTSYCIRIRHKDILLVGAVYESRLMCGRCKNTWSCRHSSDGASLAPSNKFSHAKTSKDLRVWPPEAKLSYQANNYLAWMPRGGWDGLAVNSDLELYQQTFL